MDAGRSVNRAYEILKEFVTDKRVKELMDKPEKLNPEDKKIMEISLFDNRSTSMGIKEKKYLEECITKSKEAELDQSKQKKLEIMKEIYNVVFTESPVASRAKEPSMDEPPKAPPLAPELTFEQPAKYVRPTKASEGPVKPVITTQDNEYINGFIKEGLKEIKNRLEQEGKNVEGYIEIKPLEQTPEMALEEVQEQIEGFNVDLLPAVFVHNVKEHVESLVNIIAKVMPGAQEQLKNIRTDLKAFEDTSQRLDVSRARNAINLCLDLDLFLDPLPRDNLSPNVKRGFEVLLEAFKKDCNNDMLVFFDIEELSVNIDKIEKFLIPYIPLKEERDRILDIINDRFQAIFSDTIMKISEAEKRDPGSEYNTANMTLFAEVLRHLKEATNKLPHDEFRKQCKNLGQNIESIFTKSIKTQDENDFRKESFNQIVNNYKYSFIEKGPDGITPKPFKIGGEAVVYRISAPGAKHGESTHVLKVFKDPIKPEEWKKYHPEGELAVKAVQHPNVLCLDCMLFNKQNEVIGVVSQYLSGGDLDKFIKPAIKASTPVEEGTAKKILKQTAEGLRELHHHNIAHLDFHPGNILMGGDGTVKVMDFGTSLFAKKEESVIPKLVPANYYPAPELKSSEASTKSDVYSFGVIMYQMLTGEIPIRRNQSFKNITDESVKILLKGFLDPNPKTRFTIDKFFECPYFFPEKAKQHRAFITSRST